MNVHKFFEAMSAVNDEFAKTIEKAHAAHSEKSRSVLREFLGAGLPDDTVETEVPVKDARW